MNTICRLPLPPLPLRSLVQVVPGEQVNRPLPIIPTSPLALKLCRCASCAAAVPDTEMEASTASSSTVHTRRANATVFEQSGFTRTSPRYVQLKRRERRGSSFWRPSGRTNATSATSMQKVCHPSQNSRGPALDSLIGDTLTHDGKVAGVQGKEPEIVMHAR